MLEDIRLHLDEKNQDQKERGLADHILKTHRANIRAFRAHIPSLSDVVAHSQLNNLSVFSNRHGEANIVDFGTGRAFYGLFPKKEVQRQVDNFINYPLKLDISTFSTEEEYDVENAEFEHLLQALRKLDPLNKKKPIECLVVLGCGLGYHLVSLLSEFNIKNLVLYEPETQYFKCSCLVLDWRQIFDLARKKKTQLFLQIGNDGRDILSDLTELSNHKKIQDVHIYKHYNTPVFDRIIKNTLVNKNRDFSTESLTTKAEKRITTYIPSWTAPLDYRGISSVEIPVDKFNSNMVVLRDYFPDIYKFFIHYEPKEWHPVCLKSGDINVIDKDYMVPWYDNDVRKQASQHLKYFENHPNIDGLSLGYNGNKLAHYSHYQFVSKVEPLLTKNTTDTSHLPEKIEALIMFGIGVGYQLESLMTDYEIKKLFICEPNPDFFFASLFTIDWASILKQSDEKGASIYISLGNDENHLFESLTSQFHAIGAYIQNETYFYRGYHNPRHDATVSKLREHLQIMVSMGEYFDHAMYGIAHTKENLRRNYRFLSSEPGNKISGASKQTPIFIVGNGPSLDASIHAIKEAARSAIIVSCGTALKVLHHHGVTPDFHAEVEQNRATYDWIQRVADKQYLKKINLISCNGIHPDTCDLFEEVFVVFKEGESSTEAMFKVLDKSKYQVLKYLYPTVGNLAVNVFIELGFDEIYLFGLDLGFVTPEKHHSKDSAYYKKCGEEVYDYKKYNNTSIATKGNFRPLVYTKYEFKIANQILQTCLQFKLSCQTVYNCSDGAYIKGTIPLPIEELLVVATTDVKKRSIKEIQNQAFINEDHETKSTLLDLKFEHASLVEEMDNFEALLENEVSTESDVRQLVEQQRIFLFNSYRNQQSLFFYLMYGTINYTNAVLIKLLCSKMENKSVSANIPTGLQLWRNYYKEIKEKCKFTTTHFDMSGYMPDATYSLLLKNACNSQSLLVVTNETLAIQSVDRITARFFPKLETTVITGCELAYTQRQYDYVIYLSDVSEIKHQLKGKKSTLKNKNLELDALKRQLIEFPKDFNSIFITPPKNASKTQAINSLYSEIAKSIFSCLASLDDSVIVHKMNTYDGEVHLMSDCEIQSKTLDFFEFPKWVALKKLGAAPSGLVSALGERSVRVQALNISNLIKSLKLEELETVIKNQENTQI